MEFFITFLNFKNVVWACVLGQRKEKGKWVLRGYWVLLFGFGFIVIIGSGLVKLSQGLFV